ncbi:MAG: hypothetical protein WCG75_00765 [Armatimonadota bacterium]
MDHSTAPQPTPEELYDQGPPMVAMHKIPFPPFVVALAVISIIAFGVGLVRLPKTMSLSISYSQGKQAIAENRPTDAIAKLKPIVESYPDAEDVRIELFRASVMAGDADLANAQMRFFEGRSVSKTMNTELDTIAAMADQKFKVPQK